MMIPSPLSRSQCHVLRFDLPILKGGEASQALDFKLRAAFPGYRDGLAYYTHWIKKGNMLSALVVIPREVDPSDTPLKVQTSFPLRLPASFPREVLLTLQHPPGSQELFFYKDGSLVLSHQVPSSPDTFNQLVAHFRREHPLAVWYHGEGPGCQSWTGAEKPAVFPWKTHPDTAFSPLLDLKGIPQTHRGPQVVRVALSAILIVWAAILVTNQYIQGQKTLERLQGELTQLRINQSTQSPEILEDKKILENRMKDLEALRHYPLGEVFHRLSRLQGNQFQLTGVSFREKKIRLEGLSNNTVALVETLRTDPWFKDLKPSSLRKAPSDMEEAFILEGEVMFDAQ